jgi:hypothetical protein
MPHGLGETVGRGHHASDWRWGKQYEGELRGASCQDNKAAAVLFRSAQKKTHGSHQQGEPWAATSDWRSE